MVSFQCILYDWTVEVSELLKSRFSFQKFKNTCRVNTNETIAQEYFCSLLKIMAEM